MQGEHKAIFEMVQKIDGKVDQIALDVAILKSQNSASRIRSLELENAENKGRARRVTISAGGLGALAGAIVQWASKWLSF
jgi:hypothetical protein